MPRGTDDRPYGSLELPALRGAATTAVATTAAATTATGALLSFVDAERAAVERFCRELAPLVTAGPPGIAGYAGRGIFRACLHRLGSGHRPDRTA